MALEIKEASGVFPKGVILAWYAKDGTEGEVPNGWAICDGNNGTPDLTGRFLMGVTRVSEVGKPGGKNEIENWATLTHQLTIDQIPNHSHFQPTKLHQGPNGAPVPNEYSPGFPTGNSNNWSWAGSQTGSVGNDAEHAHGLPKLDNRPAFDTVIYIMKL